MNKTTRAMAHESHQEAQATRRDEPTMLTASCHLLFSTLDTLAAEQELLDAEEILSASHGEVGALLEVVWSLRRDCDGIASSIRMVRPATMPEAAARNDALLAHAVVDGASDFMPVTWPELSGEQPSSSHPATSSAHASPLRSWLRVIQARHAS